MASVSAPVAASGQALTSASQTSLGEVRTFNQTCISHSSLDSWLPLRTLGGGVGVAMAGGAVATYCRRPAERSSSRGASVITENVATRASEASEENVMGDFCPLFSSMTRVSYGRQDCSSPRRLRGQRTRAERARKVPRGLPVVCALADVNGSLVLQADIEPGARVASIARKTKETDVEVQLNLDGHGVSVLDTGIPFLNHMLDQLASHGLFNVSVRATGDIEIDDHHTNEDIGLALGQALAEALGDRKGIHRFGDFTAPLDEALVHVVLDLSGRPHLSCDLNIPTERVGTYDTQLVEHFFQSLVNTSGMTLHIRQLAGKNSHHIIEATFKAFARALRRACEPDPRRLGTVPSSKGVLSRT